MTQRGRWILVGVLPLVLLATAPTAPAQPATQAEAVGEGINVVIHFRIGTIEGKQRSVTKSFSLVVAAGSMGSELLAGQRVPFRSVGEDGAVVYQNIGFATNAKAWVIGGDKVKLMADIEDSRIREGEGELPVVETRQLMINAVLTDGVPLELTRAEGLTDLSGYVEVEARIQR